MVLIDALKGDLMLRPNIHCLILLRHVDHEPDRRESRSKGPRHRCKRFNRQWIQHERMCFTIHPFPRLPSLQACALAHTKRYFFRSFRIYPSFLLLNCSASAYVYRARNRKIRQVRIKHGQLSLRHSACRVTEPHLSACTEMG